MTAAPSDDKGGDRSSEPPKKPANVAPDAVKDPNEKTEGKPGMGGDGSGGDGSGGDGSGKDTETDPGGG